MKLRRRFGIWVLALGIGFSCATPLPADDNSSGNRARGHAQHIGRFTYYDDGSVAQDIGHFTYYKDESPRQHIGNFIYQGDGTTSQQIGNFTYGDAAPRGGTTTPKSDDTSTQEP